MSRQEGKFAVNNFIGGFVSDFHELNTPQNVTVDEANCELDRHGSRRRRLGLDFEVDYELATSTTDAATAETIYTETFVWESVNNQGNQNFLVVQVGSVLSIYDMTKSPLSSGKFSHTIDLEAHRINSSTFDDTLGEFNIQAASGKGILFVAGSRIVPFYITYNQDTGVFTETAIQINIRDQKLQSGKTDYEDQPTSADYKLKYDYYNQGWYISNIWAHNGEDRDELITIPLLDYYFVTYYKNTPTGQNSYPPLSKAWWIGQASPDGDNHNHIRFDVKWYKTPYVGNLLAPLGHYIIDPFSIDRSAISGVTGFSVEKATDRPAAIAFHAGKVFYGWKNQIFFSQTIIDDLGVVGKCYQSADPTAEDINNLVATDGGVIPLQYSGEILDFLPYENSLIVFCSNGIWALNGSSIGQGFSADGFSIYKISGVGAVSSRTIVDIEGSPCYWGKTGIYMLQSVPAKQGFDVVNLCEKKIQFYFDTIPGLSKQYACGAYDPLKRIITWAYNSQMTSLGNLYWCDTILNYDTILGAFYKYSVTSTTPATAYICDVFRLYDVSSEVITENVVDELDAIVTDTALENVTVDRTTFGNFDTELNNGHKYLVYHVIPDEGARITFADLHDEAFTDWISVDGTGVDFKSYLDVYYVVPDPMAWSQFPYLFVYVENSTAVDTSSNTDWGDILSSPGGQIDVAWLVDRTYQALDLVVSGGNYYVSRTNANLANLPAGVTDTNWLLIGTSFPIYSGSTSYSLGQLVFISGSGIYQSQTGSNLGNDPLTDAVHWLQFAATWAAGTYTSGTIVLWPNSSTGKMWYCLPSSTTAEPPS